MGLYAFVLSQCGEHTCTSSYYHNQIRSMDLCPFLWSMPWSNDTYILHYSYEDRFDIILLLATGDTIITNLLWFLWNKNGLIIHKTCICSWYQFLAATKQLYKWYFPSVCLSVRPSVCLSVCHTFFTMFPSSYHHEIFRSYYHGQKWCPRKRSRSKVKVTEVNTQLSRFRTLTPVWIHIWQWNHAHSWKQHRRGALLFFKVIRQISRSHGSKNCWIWPRLGVSGL